MLLPPPDSKHIKERLEEHDKTEKSQDEQRHSDEKATIDQERKVEIESPTEEESDDQKTPQATPAAPSTAVPSFNLDSSNTSSDSEATSMPPPSFPAANSPQRAMPPPPKPTSKPSTPSLMPPPSFPAPNSAQRASQSTSSSLMPPPSRPTRSSLGVPAIPGRAPPTLSPAAQARAPPPRIDTPKSSSSKVKLAPGFSPLDWASLATSKNLANVSSFTRVTPSMLKEKNGRKGNDAWSVYNGKVYNITPYAPFHPGGKGELLRAAGKDGTKLFLEVHPWVNWEGMLNSCLVGVMVSESEGEGLDAMD
ncbi:hypothetical protein E4T43_08125 [Aureobasidium subglaciale]|nr:hypothetical protein E4T43_08125 [Aureobasidium subglaciale]